MATISKVALTGATSGGLPISATGTATAGAVTVHTAIAGTSSFDECWLWASNISTTQSVLLTLEWGLANDATGKLTQLLNPSEMVCVVPGIPLNNAKVIEAFASGADVINIVGYVNRIV